MRFQRTRYIPKNALPIEEPNGLGVVYVYPLGGKFGVIAYRGKATKPDFHYSYKKDTDMDRNIESWFDRLRKHKKLVEDTRAIYNAPHTFVVGDIVTNSWGYDQTNVDWYRVTRTTEHYVWLQPIAAELVTDEGCGPMSGHERLALDEHCKPIDLKGPVTKHKAANGSIVMRHGSGSKWEGESKYSSWYA